MCEIMSKILCHASRLKRDAYRLKGLPMSNRTCIMCNMYCIQDIMHIINQCPYYVTERNGMYERILVYRECPSVKKILENETRLVPYYVLGRRVVGVNDEDIICLWGKSGEYISNMYKKAISNIMGIG